MLNWEHYNNNNNNDDDTIDIVVCGIITYWNGWIRIIMIVLSALKYDIFFWLYNNPISTKQLKNCYKSFSSVWPE